MLVASLLALALAQSQPVRIVSNSDPSRAVRLLDVDSGTATEYALGVSLRIAGSGGSTEGGSIANPFGVKLTDGTLSLTLLNSSPADTNQVRLPIHILSSALGISGPTAWFNKISDGTDMALVSGTGSLQVTCDNCGAAPTFADNAAFVAGTTPVTNIGAFVDDTATTSVAENSAGAPRITPTRALHVNLRNNTGTEISPLTDAQLRATPVPISGSLTANQSVNLAQVAGAVPAVTNPLPSRDGDGTGFFSSAVIGANRYKKVASIQDITISTGNSSTANLAAGISFTGTSQTTLGTGSIQVNYFADQNATIQVQQSQEDPAVNWNIVDSWTYTASSTGSDAARTIQATASTMRVVVTNNGASATTILRLQTALCPICDSLPRGLTQLGNLKTAVQEVPTLTKGTQGTTGFTVQQLKDAGRTIWSMVADNVVPILTTDTIVTTTRLLGDTATGSVTTHAVTSGKTLRITSISMTMVPSSTTVSHVRLRLRTNSAAACTAAAGVVVGVFSLSSPPGTLAANAGGVATENWTFPDGLEFSGATRNVCLSMNALGAAAQTVVITVTGYEY